MKRAILVSSGTLAGLVAVLTYSGADVPAAIAAGPVGSAALGGPPPIGAEDDGSSSASPDASSDEPSPDASSSESPSASASPSAAASKPAAKPTTASPAAKPATKATPAPKPTPTPTPKPTPTPTPTASGPKDYVGSLYSHKYGKIQVAIRVKAGKIIAVWPVVYPNGDSQPYSDFSIPIFKSETLKAQSASIANVSGATLTWQGWKISLTSAMHKAGL